MTREQMREQRRREMMQRRLEQQQRQQQRMGMASDQAKLGHDLIFLLFLPSRLLGILPAPSPHGPFQGGEGTLDISLRPGGEVWGEMGSKLTHCRAVYSLM